MKPTTVNLIFLGICAFSVGLLFLAGCTEQQPRALVDLEPNCNSWTICTKVTRTVINVTTSDCVVGLNAGQAQKVMDILIAHNIGVGTMKCESVNQRVGDALVIQQQK